MGSFFEVVELFWIYPGEREPVGQGLNQPTNLGMTGSTSSDPLSRWTPRLQRWVF